MSDLEGILRDGAARALARPLDGAEADLLLKYLNLLIKWNRAQRLVGSSDPRWIVDKVIVDSLLFARVLPGNISTLCDVGSGAGVPGIPLKIVLPDTDVVLIEGRQKRASFLSAAVRELPLRRCRVINRRVEEVRAELAGQFQAVVMRCAGDPADLLGAIRALLAPGGIIVASGPPLGSASVGSAIEDGEWVNVDGRRRFWLYQEP